MLNRFVEVAVSHGAQKVIRPLDKVVMEEMTVIGHQPQISKTIANHRPWSPVWTRPCKGRIRLALIGLTLLRVGSK